MFYQILLRNNKDLKILFIKMPDIPLNKFVQNVTKVLESKEISIL